MTHVIAPLRATALVATTLFGLLGGVSARAETLVGLTTTNALVRFDSASPTQSGPMMSITGLLGVDERILGIDMRPATGAIYGLGSAGNVYTLNATTGAATFMAGLSTPLSGSSFGVDFNPVVDRLRITSNAGQNLRTNVDTGAVTVDAMLNGATASISASAYTNNVAGATATTLYGINGVSGMVYMQTPPNNGTQVAVGALGVMASNVAGFDISGATGTAYASLTDADTAKSGLYTINLGSGAATWIGAFGMAGMTAGAPPLLDITVAAVPEPQTWAMLLGGLGFVGWLARRRSAG